MAACSATTPGGAGDGAIPPPEALHPERPTDLPEGTVEWVIDGDSLEVTTGTETLEVRLVGLNATERNECFYEEALDYLIDNAKSRTVGVETVGTDQFGRTLANLWLGDDLLNLTLVLNGLAIAQTGDGSATHAEAILDAEELAHQDRIGLWAAGACGVSGETILLEVVEDLSEFDPPGPDDDYLDLERVALRNAGERSLDLAGFVLRDESSANRYVFPADSIIAPDEVIEIDSGCESTYSICSGRSIWNNNGDMVLVLDRLGNVVARFRY